MRRTAKWPSLQLPHPSSYPSSSEDEDPHCHWAYFDEAAARDDDEDDDEDDDGDDDGDDEDSDGGSTNESPEEFQGPGGEE